MSVTSSTTTTTTISPQSQCECLNATGLQMDIDLILSRLDNLSQQNTNLTEVTDITSKLSGIEESVQNKLCQCADGTNLLEIAVETKSMVSHVVLFANESAGCACTNMNIINNGTKAILAMLETLHKLVQTNTDLLKKCEAEATEIKAKINILIDIVSGVGSCNILKLELDNVHMKKTLAEILKKACEIRDRGCVCEDRVIASYEKLSEKVQAIFNKLDLPSHHRHQWDTDLIINFLEKMDKKLDQIIEKDATTIKQEHDCLTVTQFQDILPIYCHDKHNDNKNKVKPWELPEEAKGELLSEYEGCIKEAIRFFDDWFENNAWSRMPTKVKQLMIEIYCRIGKRNMSTFKKLKKKLEAGNWKYAAREFLKTNYAKRYPVFSKVFAKKLYDVQEKMARERKG